MDDLFTYFDKFNALLPSSKEALKKICSEINIPKNNILQEIGATCKTIYFVKSGVARIYYYKDGNDITEHFSFEGNIIARVESLFTGRPSQKAIQVLEDATIIAIDAVQLFKLYDEYPDIERLFRLIFEAEHVHTVKRLESLQFHTALERYQALLKEKEVVQRIPLKHIASYLGITQVSLSRIRTAIT
jgi:CRP-like cAMP-binding protein